MDLLEKLGMSYMMRLQSNQHPTVIATTILALVIVAGVTRPQLTQAATSKPLAVPLTIHELLAAGDSGVARANELASFGIPLNDADGIQSVNQLGLTGSSAYQFKSLSVYPSGNIQWVLVDTLATVPAVGSTLMTLTNGAGSIGGANLATDQGATIAVDTGPAQFAIRKANYNGIDQAIINGATLVASGHAGGLELTLGNGLIYYSHFDTPIVTITENGPVKAVVKVEGRFKDAGGANAPMGYTLYLTFAKDATNVLISATLRNAYRAVYAPVEFNAFEMVLPTALGAGKSFAFAASKGNQTGALGPGENVFLLQGFSRVYHRSSFDDDYLPSYYMTPPMVYTYSNYTSVGTGEVGVKIAKNSVDLKPFSTDTTGDYAL